MNELKNFEGIFKNYYSEIDVSNFKIEDKEIEEYHKKFEEKGINNVDENRFYETILMSKIVDSRINNLKKTRESFSKLKLNKLLDDKDITELNILFDVTIESLGKVDIFNLSKEDIYKNFISLQEKLDQKMILLSTNYVTKLVEEIKQSNDYNTFASAKQSIENANLPKEAMDVFKTLTADFGKPEVQNSNENKNEVQEQNTVEQNNDVKNEESIDAGEINAEQQAIRNNEGSLENNSNQSIEQTLQQRIRNIENNSTVKYGARVTEQINEFNVDNENKRIEKLKELREKKGKLSLGEALELRMLVEKSELRKQREVDNTVVNKVGDALLSRTNRKLEETIEKQQIAQQKYNVTKSFFSNRKLNRLNKKLSKLREKKGKLTSFQINEAMFARNLSEKILTAAVIKNKAVSKFKSVKDKVMNKIRSNQNTDIVLTDAPVIIDIPSFDLALVESRTL